MMPSRGLAARGKAAWILHPQPRTLSSISRIALRTSHRSTPVSALQSRSWRQTASLAIPTIASVRHLSWWGASSSSSPSTPSTATLNAIPTPSTASPIEAASTAPPPPVEISTAAAGQSEGAFPNLDTITLDSSDIVNPATQAPDTIGYLNSLGLENGWLTSIPQSLLEHIHVYSGMPWWGSIAATAVLLRVITLPFYIKASDQNARAMAMMSVTRPITTKLMEAMRDGDQTTALQYQQQNTAIRKRAGLSYWAQFQPAVYQSVISFCGFHLIRSLVNLPVPELKNGGLLWLSDLTVPDPYGILPLIMAASMHLMVRLGGESGTMSSAQMTPGMKSFMYYAMPGLLLLFMGWQPGALCIWFAASGSVGLTQALLLQKPAVRQYLGLAPIYKPAAGEKSVNPFESMLEMYRGRSKASQSSSRGDMPRYSRGELYMNVRYQAPTLNTRPSSPSDRVIDVGAANKNKAPTPDDDMISANRPDTSASRGISGGTKIARAKTKKNMREQVELEEKRQRIKSQKKAAEEYEQRARRR